MKNQVLNIEQMEELKELGVDTSNASMCWEFDRTSIKENKIYYYFLASDKIYYDSEEWYVGSKFENIPTFTLQDILEILGKVYKTEPFESYYIEPINIRNNEMRFVKDWYDGQRDRIDVLYSVKEDTLLKSAFQMLKWCKINNKL